ncbi:MAG: hypothetical protein AAFV53_07745 [Myxococcota bacterium]
MRLLPLTTLLAASLIACDGDKDSGVEEIVEPDPGGGALSLAEDDVDLSASTTLSISGTATISDDGIRGTIDYDSTFKGDDTEIRCDVEISFSGEPYTGGCEDCDFAFSIDETELTEGSAHGDDCVLQPEFSFIEDEDFSDLFLTYRSASGEHEWREGPYGGSSEYTTRQFSINGTASYHYGYGYDGYGYGGYDSDGDSTDSDEDTGGRDTGAPEEGYGDYYGDYYYDYGEYTRRFHLYAYSKTTRTEYTSSGSYGPYSYSYVSPGSTFTYSPTEGSVFWTIERERNFVDLDGLLFNYCDGFSYSEGTVSGGRFTGTEDVACDGTMDYGYRGDYGYYGYDDGYDDGYYEDYYGEDYGVSAIWDYWDLEGEAGDRMSVNIDTVASDSAFDPVFLVIAPSGCLTAIGASNDDCSHGDHECPASSWVAEEDGVYQVLVGKNGTCSGSTASYKISADVY